MLLMLTYRGEEFIPDENKGKIGTEQRLLKLHRHQCVI